VIRALLQAGADPTIADDNGITPMAIAKQMLAAILSTPAEYRERMVGRFSVEARRECAAMLEVSFGLPLAPALLIG
jgi:hypothetical protein